MTSSPTGTPRSGPGPSRTRSLSAGTRLGPYEIVALVGAGGMGEVYRAVDTRLNRTVALKILPEPVTDDPHRRQRFEREAEIGSRLAHPHICAVYDVGRARPERRDSCSDLEGDRDAEVGFLVMEYVEGETLGSRLMRGALSLDDALRDAIEITSAVDYAHRRGVLHRDLKPANIMITPTGVKLLDFGLAKASPPLDSQATSSPTLTATQTLTEQGTILGTLNYMSPEQLEGGSIDGRADIFAIGAVIYEMVTGQRAFSGASRASVIGAVLRADLPAPSVLRPTTPSALDRTILKCLARTREQRWQTASDLASELAWIRDSHSSASRQRRESTASRLRTGLAATMLVAATSAATVLVKDRWIDRRAPDLPPSIQFTIQPPPGVSFLDSNAFMAVSPNGRAVVFIGSDQQGRELLWIRSVDSVDARPLQGSEGARMPFWAPDSSRVGFFADENKKLKTVDVQGGNLHTVCAIDKPLGGAWSQDGVILIGGGAKGVGIRRVSAAGGVPTAATTIEASGTDIAHNWPVFLPDGKRFLFRAKGGSSTAVVAGSIDSPERTSVLHADVNPEFVPPGYLLTGTNGTLVAQPFDPSTLRLSGSAVVLKQPVRFNDGTGRAAVSASQSTLVYRQPEETELRWFNRKGDPLGLAAAAARYLDPELSPDGLRLALARIDPDLSTSTISILELASGRIDPVTSGRRSDRGPVWSTDGRTLLFSSREAGLLQFYEQTIGAVGSPVQVYAGATGIALDRTNDGTLLFGKEGSYQLWVSTAQGVTSPLESRFTERQARFSHDKRWMAYVSDESSRNEVYIRPASGGASENISTGGGLEPRWRQDGRELFYLAPGGDLMAVDLTVAGAVIKAGKPRVLFHSPLTPSIQFVSGRNQYDVSPDGQRFIMNMPVGSAPITVVWNWQAALRR